MPDGMEGGFRKPPVTGPGRQIFDYAVAINNGIQEHCSFDPAPPCPFRVGWLRKRYQIRSSV
jgi:hypothetical protein